MKKNDRIFIVLFILSIVMLIISTRCEREPMQHTANIKPNKLFVIKIVDPTDSEKKYGYIDNTGKVIVKPQFLYALEFSDGLGCVCSNDKRFGFIDETGKMVIPPQFNRAESFSEGLAPVQVNNKYGYIDKVGKIIIEPMFTLAWGFCNELAVVELNGEIGFIDKTGKMVIQPQFERDCIRSFSEGLAAVNFEGKWVDYKVEGGKWGYINTKGEVVIKPQFDNARSFTEGLACIYINNKWGCIDKIGRIVIQPEFDWICDFADGVAVVNIEGKKPGRVGGWGFIDKTGMKQVELRFFSVMNPFSEGLLAVQIKPDAKVGYIDKTGNIVIKPQFDCAFPFSNGLAKILIKDNGNKYKEAYIDKTGKYVWMSTTASETPNESTKDKPIDGK